MGCRERSQRRWQAGSHDTQKHFGKRLKPYGKFRKNMVTKSVKRQWASWSQWVPKDPKTAGRSPIQDHSGRMAPWQRTMILKKNNETGGATGAGGIMGGLTGHKVPGIPRSMTHQNPGMHQPMYSYQSSLWDSFCCIAVGWTLMRERMCSQRLGVNSAQKVLQGLCENSGQMKTFWGETGTSTAALWWQTRRRKTGRRW